MQLTIVKSTLNKRLNIKPIYKKYEKNNSTISAGTRSDPVND